MVAMLGVRRVGDRGPGAAVSQRRRAHRKAKQRRGSAARRGMGRGCQEGEGWGSRRARAGQVREAGAAGRGRGMPAPAKTAARTAPLFQQRREEEETVDGPSCKKQKVQGSHGKVKFTTVLGLK
jgi:hypothetical protein